MKTLILALIVMSCASNPEKIREVDNKIVAKGKMGNHILGVNDDGVAILQKETDAVHVLYLQKSLNLEFERDLRWEQFQLQECVVAMADPRLGGEGKYIEIESESQNVKPAAETSEFGENEEGDLVVVEKKSFVQELKSATQHETFLRKMIAQTETQRKKCQYNLKMARMKSGLPEEVAAYDKN